MKGIIIATALAAAVALPGAVGAQTRDDIMERVIWPCVDHEVQKLDLEERHAEPAAIIMFELDRDFYEKVIDAVEVRSTERCRITSSIRAVAMPARCSSRNGWPAATERS